MVQIYTIMATGMNGYVIVGTGRDLSLQAHGNNHFMQNINSAI